MIFDHSLALQGVTEGVTGERRTLGLQHYTLLWYLLGSLKALTPWDPLAFSHLSPVGRYPGDGANNVWLEIKHGALRHLTKAPP